MRWKVFFADVDADRRNGLKATGVAWYGMLLILVAPNQLCGLVGREHGGSIPLADMTLRVLDQFGYDERSA